MTAELYNDIEETTGEIDQKKVAELISMTLKDFEGNKEKVRAEVRALCEKYPLYE